jgi:hypothetical protein
MSVLELAMTIRQILRFFVRDKCTPRTKVPRLDVFRSPGMHQSIKDPGQIVFTQADYEFLQQLGISVDSNRAVAEEVCSTPPAKRVRPQSSLRV